LGSGSRVDLTLEVLYPDLTFRRDPQILSDSNEGFIIGTGARAIIGIMNNGSIPTENVTIGLYLNDVLVSSEIVNLIEMSNTSYEITIAYNITRYITSLRIEIDPVNRIVESNDQFMDEGTHDNNVFTTWIEARDPTKNVGSGESILAIRVCVIMIILIVIACLGVALYNQLKNKKNKLLLSEE
jgi:hypothetical protein